jgi:hypothetical protein
MSDRVDRFCAAYEARDVDAVMAELAPDAELVSPLSARFVFRGDDDVRRLLAAVFASIHAVRWHEHVGEGSTRVILGEARVGPLLLTDAMVLDLAEDGRIRRVRPHLRPWLAVTLFALLMAPRVARHPGLIRRALT